ncbi:MAG TPA: DUF72 domain-containing protein [Planctomycetota bacterium]|nr:DUF72 domain-containing protein [Planctomycetota bacterium]
MIRIGTAGWSYADWEGRVYPRSKPRGFHPLAFLARYVDCVELNSSFYALPDPRHVESWVRLVETRPAFRFTAKLSGALTHEHATDVAQASSAFRAALAPLAKAGRLGALLAQFPLGFRDGPATRERLQRLHEGLVGLPLAIELRHASWFEPGALVFLGGLGDWSLAEIDLPEPPAGSRARHGPRQAPHLGPIGYLRVHGRNQAAWFDPRADRDQKYDYLYDESEVAELARRARRLAGSRDETYVITNNHFGGQALANALELRALLTAERVAAPADLVRSFPRLERTTRSDGQQELF